MREWWTPRPRKRISLFPTDTKLAAKIVRRGVKIARREEIVLRQSFICTVPKLLCAQRGRRSKGGALRARKAARRLKTIVGQVLRQLDRALSQGAAQRHLMYSASLRPEVQGQRPPRVVLS